MANHVPDSTDWLNTPLSIISPLDAALRCLVCRDFYQTPMVTDCGHTFCSVCIRRVLSNEGKCPLCRSRQQENKLRNSVPLGEAVEAFVSARKTVLEFARKPNLSPEPAPPTSPKRKLQVADEPNKRPRTSARLSRRRHADISTSVTQVEVDCQSMDLDWGGGNEDEDEDKSYIPPKDGLVACPICQQRMKEAFVSPHMDTDCPGLGRGGPQQNGQAYPPPKPVPGLSASGQLPGQKATTPLERLPAINYSMLKDQPLRKKLSELGISSQGPRQILEKRHKEWMTIWNANCDSRDPKQKRELIRSLDAWERTQGVLAPTTSKAIVVGSKIKDKDFDAAAWSEEHSDSFQDLIARARKSAGNSKQKRVEKVKAEGSVPGLGSDSQTQVEGPITKAAAENQADDYSPPPKSTLRSLDRADLATAQEIYDIMPPAPREENPTPSFGGGVFAPGSSQTITESPSDVPYAAP